MRSGLLHIILFFTLVLVSCEKEPVDSGQFKGLLKFPEIEGAYVARDVLSYPDGSIVLSCISMLEGTFNTFDDFETPQPALLIKYSSEGKLLWTLQLPDEVKTLWHCTLLANGDILVVGLPANPKDPYFGVARVSSMGELVTSKSIFNQVNIIYMSIGGLPTIDCLELHDGNIAIAVPSPQATNLPTLPRLLVLDAQLNIVFDRFYKPDGIIRQRNSYEMRLTNDNQGNLILNGRDLGATADSIRHFAYVVKLQASTWEPLYHEIFGTPSIESISPAAANSQGQVIQVSTGPAPGDTSFQSLFNFRNQELFYIGNSIKLWVSNGTPSQVLNRTISGFPKYAYVNQLKSCSDGGYILYGTCNINRNQQIASDYQLMIIKLDAALNLQWMRFPETGVAAVSGDITETESGFVVSASYVNAARELKPVIFTINEQGNN